MNFSAVRWNDTTLVSKPHEPWPATDASFRTNGRMSVERVEQRRDVGRALFGDAASGRVCKLVRRANENVEKDSRRSSGELMKPSSLLRCVGLTGDAS